MGRTLTAGMQTAVAAQTGTFVHLFQIESSGGTTRLCSAAQSISWNSQTWTASQVLFDAVSESGDVAAQGTELTFSGVDQSMISHFLNNSFRGRDVTIWRAHIASDGTVIADPVNLGVFLQLADWRVRENITRDASTCIVSTRIVSKLAAMDNPVATRTNVVSHNDMLARAGLSTGDTGFLHVPNIGKSQFVRWGPFDIGRRGTAKRRGT